MTFCDISKSHEVCLLVSDNNFPEITWQGFMVCANQIPIVV